VEFSVL